MATRAERVSFARYFPFPETRLWLTHGRTEKREKLDRSCGAFDIGRVFESVVVSCSDQQIFTGGAYAITLRFYKGCSVTAYHYNIIAKMLLLTCATHLLSVAVVRHYWRYPLLAGIRVAVITGVFVVTGLLLGNQNATNRIPFPSEVPPLKQPDSYLLMSAACFQASNSPFIRTFTTSFKDEEHAKKAFLEARPGNKIEGWNFYLFILFCYGAAILVEIGKMVVRSNQRKQFFNMSQGLKSTFLSGKSGSLIRGLSRFAYGLYLAACVAISGVTIGFQVTQLFGLRRWARRSGWLETNEGGLSEEDDWSTFGQLVPMFLGLLTLFTFVENISRKFPAFACTNGSTDNIARNVQQTKQTDGDRRPR